MVTMATELFKVAPDTIDKLKSSIYVLKDSMNMQKGIQVFIDNRQLVSWFSGYFTSSLFFPTLSQKQL